MSLARPAAPPHAPPRPPAPRQQCRDTPGSGRGACGAGFQRRLRVLALTCAHPAISCAARARAASLDVPRQQLVILAVLQQLAMLLPHTAEG